MEPADGPKEETRPRRRRRSGDSVHSVSLKNTPPDTGRGPSARSRSAELTPSGQHSTSLAPISLVTIEHSTATTARSPVETSSTGPSPGRHTGKRRASGEMIHREEAKTMQPSTPQAPTATGNEIRNPDLPKEAVVSPTVHSISELETPREQDAQENQPHTPNLPQRVSTRRTTTTTRWSPSMAGAPRVGAQRASRAPRGSTTSMVTPPARPISNATRNISFDMLQPHFERPLQQAADSFGVCTTLLKKICRRNGISSWPYRKICGLRKSITSMAKQVNYFDGEQKRAYADQLEKLEHELQAYLRTGNEPTEEFIRRLHADTTEQQQHQSDTAEIGNEDEEKEAQAVPAWTARPSIVLPHYSGVHPTYELQPAASRLAATRVSANTWSVVHSRPRGPPLQVSAFPTIATHHRALPSIASILQHQSYSSPSRAASTQNPSTAPQYELDQQQQWRYFPPTNGDAV
ncbi:hypothetical protein PC129_g12654 [Phytophthora cactorum]|uniref:RWP-RK domain-containing protein n=1 Tax=Phytophthora cactorum TaxID=29920 RepID=A0A329SW65_9STRA|nr:hypothetical protein Pcac1_g9488 [Phytophthora cactorum]KAG2816015.1 hypothetical protein PC111_g13314 [Phytophthora cactorum]KAG2821448.1 hypothetical protein PC112_g11373 [Phytophthora cactorum]KAG2853788.1 hypothetical protein PC113_g13873 [Phytophthora cactorum]KAG2897537.1 hypothetical protein PC114_g14628 [Phytophthora cactorum]